MTKDDITEVLKPLAEAINLGIASKQHVFNEHLDLVIKCKTSGVSNQLITECINVNLPTDKSVDITYLKNILYRAGYKRSPKTLSQKSSSSVIEKTDDIPATTSVSESEMEKYMAACFRSQRLAQRAIDSGVSLETIESWKSPNMARLSSTLSNYLSKK